MTVQPKRPPANRPPADRESVRVSPVARIGIVILAALAATAAAASYSGATAAAQLTDSGAVVRWGIPTLRVIVDLAASLTIGTAVLAATALPLTRRRGSDHPVVWPPAGALLAVSAAAWGASTALLAALSYADIAAVPLNAPGFGDQLVAFLSDVSLGQGYSFTIVIAVVISMIGAGLTTLNGAAWAALLGMIGLIPAALAGHSAGSSSHESAVTALGVHLLGVTVWVGGLIALGLLWTTLDPAQRVSSVRRYSPLAQWGAYGVLVGGVLSTATRLSGPAELVTTRYGQLITLKVALFVALITAGVRHRRSTLSSLERGVPGAFVRLAAAEILAMAIALGLAAALARSAPPAQDIQPELTLTESLTGYPLPDPPTLARWVFSWQPDLLWVIIVVLAALGYVGAVIRLRSRGDQWPATRIVVWLVGLVLLLWVTSGGPMVYGRVQFSAHMAGHMVLGMGVPMLLVLAAPFTLALRALPARGDGSRGPREWLLAALESRYSRVMTNPPIAVLIFAGTLFAFYFSPLFEIALRTHVGHELMHVHFLAAGFLFMWVLIGIDPGPRRPAPAFRLIVMLLGLGVHTFFAVSVMLSRTVLAESYWSGVGRTWGGTLLQDQQRGGGIAWAFGELPMVAVALILSIQWARSDTREARRNDRKAALDDDAELRAYNAMLTRGAAIDDERAQQRSAQDARGEADR